MYEIDLMQNNKEVADWWGERGMIIIPDEFLSKFGFIVSNEEKSIAAAWLYPMVSSNTAMIRYPITNPNSTKEERNKALDLLFFNLQETAKEMGYKKMFITTNNNALSERLIKYNYTETSKNCRHFWGSL